MISVECVRIENFRGIRDLKLDLASESYLVVGPNGSGKSGVVDALEFLLTGEVSRLAGSATGDVSLRQHGPHVLTRDEPSIATVTATIRHAATGETAELRRSVDSPSDLVIDTEAESVAKAMEEIAVHPEIVLTRRQILKFILATPNKRGEQIQSLLRLDRLTKTRLQLRKAKGTIESSAANAAQAVTNAKAELATVLGIDTYTDAAVVAETNTKHALLGRDPVDSLDAIRTSESPNPGGRTQKVAKATVLLNVDTLETRAGAEGQTSDLGSKLTLALAPLDTEPSLLQDIDRSDLVDLGLSLLVDDLCPLCDVEWVSPDELKAHLEAKQRRLSRAVEVKSEIDEAGASIARHLQAVTTAVESVRRNASELEQAQVAERLGAWVEVLEAIRSELVTPQGVISLGQQAILQTLDTPAEVAQSLASFRVLAEALPDESAADEAQALLVVAQARLETLHTARGLRDEANSARDVGEALYEAYCAAQDEVLENLYESIAETFVRYYRTMNPDEESFTAQLEPQGQSVSMLVDFYGHATVPPIAYHSEGHQDAMGIAMYLALMKHELGERFTLAILDDVVMSVDADHRIKFSQLLQTEFPDIQFIITTHDKLWAEEMVRSKLISKDHRLRINRWDVDSGPSVASVGDFWDEIDEALDNNKVPQAAWVLRHNLEWILSDLSNHFRGMVPYNATGAYSLGDFISAVKGRISALLVKATKAANSWGDDDAKARVKTVKDTWSDLSLAQEGEQWMINPAVHFNDWATFSVTEFTPVVEAWRKFLAFLECDTCGGRIYVTTSDNADDSLRCACGATNLNLRRKP
ncbi:MAG: AAA family ATPase [Actinobacteria bacterium]|nr:AAA family ATPase [Actinomycetota bacterium]